MTERTTTPGGGNIGSLLQQTRTFLFTAVLAVLVGALGFSCRAQDVPEHPAEGDTSSTTIENVRAFAKLYGYIRYFHPSDAASAIDWERFAVHGVQSVTDASSPDELRETLEALFQPIAPTVQFYATDEDPPAPAAVLTPADTAGLKLVAWQHLGVGLGNPGPYRSIRLNRLADAPAHPASPASFAQRIDATPFRGTTIRLSASVRTDARGGRNQARLGLYTMLPSGQFGFVDFMEDHPITNSAWETYTITGTVGEDADSIGLGGMFFGSGGAWFDDFQLHVRAEGEEQWSPVRLDNAGFEADAAEDLPVGWGVWGEGYRVQIDTLESYEGTGSLAIEYDDTPRIARPLFEEHPEAGEVVERPLGRGLSAQIPLALYSRDEQTLRPDDAPPMDRLDAELQQIPLDELTAADEALRYADVMMAWNVLQHFYPYFDVVDVDWDEVLTQTLHRASAGQTPRDFLRTLQWMMAQLEDGHGDVYHPLMQEEAVLPFLVDKVEGQVAIVALRDPANENACFERGDVVISIDGVPSEQMLSESKQYISGSSQWKTGKALRQFGRGERGTQARLVLDRAGQTVTCDVVRDFNGPIREKRPGVIEEIQENVYYVDLDRAEMSAIEEAAQTLAEADGVIFDLRGYPNGNDGVLQYLSSDTLYSALWQVPKLIYPDQMDLKYHITGRWIMPPRQPQFTGTIVFLTDGRAISYAESVMGIVEHYQLGEIVGQPTAGANGNVNPFVLLGGYRLVWTGMHVDKHDGSQLHMVGIQPTVPVERTLEGVREGRDEYLEKALELIGL